MPGLLHHLCLVPLTVALTAPALAQAPPRGYACTNIMGGNPFRLTIFDDLTYIAAPFAGTKLPSAIGEGKLELAENPIYYNVLGGPLLDELKVDTVHIMSPTRLSPSGSNGLFDCEKAK